MIHGRLGDPWDERETSILPMEGSSKTHTHNMCHKAAFHLNLERKVDPEWGFWTTVGSKKIVVPRIPNGWFPFRSLSSNPKGKRQARVRLSHKGTRALSQNFSGGPGCGSLVNPKLTALLPYQRSICGVQGEGWYTFWCLTINWRLFLQVRLAS